MTVQQFLEHHELALTLTNNHGEAVYLGEALTVKPQKDRHYLRFAGTLEESVSPYTKAILHDGFHVFSVVSISPVRVNGTTSIDIVI